MVIYYFSPNYVDYECSDDVNIQCMSAVECENEWMDNEEVFKYCSPIEFEDAFNNEFISDLGYIRIFA